MPDSDDLRCVMHEHCHEHWQDETKSVCRLHCRVWCTNSWVCTNGFTISASNNDKVTQGVCLLSRLGASASCSSSRVRPGVEEVGDNGEVETGICSNKGRGVTWCGASVCGVMA